MARVITVMWDGEWRRTTTILPQSIIAQYFHKPFWVLEELESSAADVMWKLCTAPQTVYLHNTCTKPLSSRIGQICSRFCVRYVCCCYSNNLLHNTSTNPWVLQELGTSLLQQILCEVCAAATQTIYCTTLPQALEFSKNWKLMHQMLCDLDVLLLKSSLLHNTFRNPFELSKNWTLSSAADDVVWTLCCYWNNNLLHITSTNPWVSQRLGHFLQQMMLCELYVLLLLEQESIAQHFHNLFEVLKLDTSAAKVCVWLSLKFFFLSFIENSGQGFYLFFQQPKISGIYIHLNWPGYQ
jgi:hypothetical protein